MCMRTPEIWEGTAVYFHLVARILSAKKISVPLRDQDAERCKEVSSVFRAATQELSRCTEEGVRWKCFFMRFAEYRGGWPKYSTQLGKAVPILNALIVGQLPPTSDIAETAQLCREVGDHILTLRMQKLESDDDDD